MNNKIIDKVQQAHTLLVSLSILLSLTLKKCHFNDPKLNRNNFTTKDSYLYNEMFIRIKAPDAHERDRFVFFSQQFFGTNLMSSFSRSAETIFTVILLLCGWVAKKCSRVVKKYTRKKKSTIHRSQVLVLSTSSSSSAPAHKSEQRKKM